MESRGTEEIVIEPGRTERNYLRDLWRYRELLYILAWRDVKVRYKQTLIGGLWAIVRPAVTLIVFTVVFGKFAKLPADGDIPYALMVLGGVLPWQFFASAVSESSNSLIGNERLITRVYFPRLIIPVSVIVTSLIDFLIALVLLFGLMGYYRFAPSPALAFLPFFLMLAILPALGLGLWLGALNVRFRDVRYVIPFVLQLGLFLSPVGFSTSVVPAGWQVAYALNPIVGIISGFRWCIAPAAAGAFPWMGAGLSAAVSVAILFGGFVYFRKMEKSFADII